MTSLARRGEAWPGLARLGQASASLLGALSGRFGTFGVFPARSRQETNRKGMCAPKEAKTVGGAAPALSLKPAKWGSGRLRVLRSPARDELRLNQAAWPFSHQQGDAQGAATCWPGRTEALFN